MSSHYKTQDPLPDDLITKIIKRSASTFQMHVLLGDSPTCSRYVNVGLFSLRQIVYATFDLVAHNNSLGANPDYTKLWNELRQQIMHVRGGDQPGQCGFGHMAGEYDVGLYGYVAGSALGLP